MKTIIAVILSLFVVTAHAYDDVYGGCTGPIIMGECHGSTIGKPIGRCHGDMINGECTGPMF